MTNSAPPARLPSPPSFKRPVVDMQQLAVKHLGHRIELFCPLHRGCPRAEVTWTKDGVRLVERGRKSGLSTIRMDRSGGIVIEVGFPPTFMIEWGGVNFNTKCITNFRTIKRKTMVTIHVQ